MNSVNNRRQTDDSVELSTLNHGSNNHSAMISNGNNRSDFQIISSQLHPHHNYHDSQLPQVFIIQQQQQQQQHQQSEQRQQQNSSYDQRLKFGLNFRTIIILIVAIIIASIAIRSLYKSFRCDPNHYRYRYSGSNGHPVHSVFRIAENRRYVIEDGVRSNDRDCQAQLGSSLERMQQVCKQYRLNNHLLSPWHSTTPESCKTTRLCPLMIDNSTKIMACFLPRVFEPEWFQKSFAYQYDHPQLMSMIQQAQLVNNTSYIRIMFVRHPFVRLVDAFKKRFELAEFLPDGRPLIINNETMHVWTFEEWCEELLLPIDPYQYDPLWAPIWTQCEPCYVRYDLVGHYETFYQDFQNARQLFTNHSDISDNKNVDIPIVNDRDCDKRSYQETQQYIRRLKPKTIMALYAKYYLDFELFGYTIDEIF
ncbi:hypothetical protein HUG17_0681 [Dermatophagoides farinae]|uniref:Carbohydrate sulfotransferase n=1 Tax=Dermatophagoides farinae TaxID=6954 RepID=A0A9D4SKF0_DERFA|nr:hypothetical protein HUG17_0681 [Dermatophagoides farinae]